MLESVLNGMDAYLYVSDPETDEILFINDKMREHFGIKSAGVGEICWKTLQSGMESRCPFCPMHQLSANPGAIVEWEEHNTATLRYYKNTDRLIAWPDGRMVHLQHSVDITGLKEAELATIAAREEAEKSNRAKSDFLARMSHEMRTPMNAIIGMGVMALKSVNVESKDYCLKKISSASRHLLGIINDVLDMSQIEAGKMELACDDFDLEETIETIVDMLDEKMAQKGHVLKIDVAPDVPRRIIGDKQRLSQTLTNMLSNAVKFTPEKGKLALEARLEEKNGAECTLRFNVRDNGIGIAKEQLEKLFRPFEQGDGGIARRFDGTGLGLVICKRLVELMGGQIRVESDPDKGSCFSFTVKVAAARNGLQLHTEATPSALPRFDGQTVLLAEDNDINGEIVRAMLEEAGLNMRLAMDGRQVVETFAQNPDGYSLIFMDVHMPEIDGLEATRRIRAMPVPRAKSIPIVAMTANVFKGDVEKCLAAGMNAHVGKPLEVDEVYKVLSKFVR